MILNAIVSYHMGIQTLGNLLFYAVEGTTANKEDILCIHLYVFLIGMLSTPLRRNIHFGTLQEFQQALLNALSTHITCNAGVVALTGNLIYLVYKDNTTFCSLNIVISNLKQTTQNTFYILAYITGLSENRSIDNSKRNFQQIGYSSCQQGFTRTGRTYHNNIAFFYLHAIIFFLLSQSFIMIINRYREIALCIILSYYILVQIFLDLLGLRNIIYTNIKGLAGRFGSQIFLHNAIGLHSAIAADIAVDSRQQ